MELLELARQVKSGEKVASRQQWAEFEKQGWAYRDDTAEYYFSMRGLLEIKGNKQAPNTPRPWFELLENEESIPDNPDWFKWGEYLFWVTYFGRKVELFNLEKGTVLYRDIVDARPNTHEHVMGNKNLVRLDNNGQRIGTLKTRDYRFTKQFNSVYEARRTAKEITTYGFRYPFEIQIEPWLLEKPRTVLKEQLEKYSHLP